jgi:hypothetical protein
VGSKRSKTIIIALLSTLFVIAVSFPQANAEPSPGYSGRRASIKAHGTAGPGWVTSTAEPVTHEEANGYYEARRRELTALGQIGPLMQAEGLGILSATATSPEIEELARGLLNDPKLIYDYVHNHIDYVPYFGSLKGATLTYLDGSGNDFDQASLLIALLRAGGYTAKYVYGTMTIPGGDLANWLGVDQSGTTIGTVLGSGGISVGSLLADGTATVTRVWVRVNIDGADYLFDPAFKSYDHTGKINLGGALGYNQDVFMTAATSGATVGGDYVQNMNEAQVKSRLKAYSTKLVGVIRNQYPNHDLKEIIGGSSIVETNLNQY